VFGKLESHNPTGIIKDRIALEMIRDVKELGWLLPGHTLVEPTSGNAVMALAKVVITISQMLVRGTCNFHWQVAGCGAGSACVIMLNTHESHFSERALRNAGRANTSDQPGQMCRLSL